MWNWNWNWNYYDTKTVSILRYCKNAEENNNHVKTQWTLKLKINWLILLVPHCPKIIKKEKERSMELEKLEAWIMINGNQKHNKVSINLVEASSFRLSSCLFEFQFLWNGIVWVCLTILWGLALKGLKQFTSCNSKRNFISVENDRTDTALAILYSLTTTENRRLSDIFSMRGIASATSRYYLR